VSASKRNLEGSCAMANKIRIHYLPGKVNLIE
jgi:hypothetical protein